MSGTSTQFWRLACKVLSIVGFFWQTDAYGLPPNHPPVELQSGSAVPESTVEASRAVSPGVIEVSAVDGSGTPVANVRIELVRNRNSVAEGKETGFRFAMTDGRGMVSFSNVTSSKDALYRLLVNQNGIRYGTPPFSVEAEAGTKSVLRVLPQVTSLSEALVASRSFLFLEPRDETIQVEIYTELQNLGGTVWIPRGVDLRLPEPFQAFATNETDPDVRVESVQGGVRLSGVVSPGVHNVSYSFQIPSNNESFATMTLPLWPHNVELRVATLSRPGLSLDVEGLPKAEVTTSADRKPLLLTARTFVGGDVPAPREVRLTMDGLPVTGSGRWVAVALALGLAVSGMTYGRRRGSPSSGSRLEPAEVAARARIIDELADLERARRNGEIGDAVFAEVRESLLAACVRLERNILSNRNN